MPQLRICVLTMSPRSWAVATCFFFASVVSLTFPPLLVAAGPTGAFGFYTGTNVLALIMIFFLMPGMSISCLPYTAMTIIFTDMLYPFRNKTTHSGGTWLRLRCSYFDARWIPVEDLPSLLGPPLRTLPEGWTHAFVQLWRSWVYYRFWEGRLPLVILTYFSCSSTFVVILCPIPICNLRSRWVMTN